MVKCPSARCFRPVLLKKMSAFKKQKALHFGMCIVQTIILLIGGKIKVFDMDGKNFTGGQT